MSTDATKPAVGFVGLGDQGLPMATAVARAGYPLHAWARRSASLDALGDTEHVGHDTTGDLGAACDVVGLCVSSDENVMRIVTGGLRPGAVVVNHGTRYATKRRPARRDLRTAVDPCARSSRCLTRGPSPIRASPVQRCSPTAV